MSEGVLTVEEIVQLLRNPNSVVQVETNPNMWVGVKGYTAAGQVKTQKAKGLYALNQGGFQTPWYAIIRHEDAAEAALKRAARAVPGWAEALARGETPTVFARPCPIRPRHGFVDSRPIHDAETLAAVMREAKAEDEEAEVIIMPFLDAAFSAIWTPSSLSMGPGNDGATSGKDAIHLQQTSDYMRQHHSGVLKSAGVGEDDDPFIEIVVTGGKKPPPGAVLDGFDSKYRTQLVQLRAGPRLGHHVDYIPGTVEVSNIVETRGESLLEWERRVQDLGIGDVVWHPGGTLASHYSVHCITKGIPVLISREPRIGEVLEPTESLPDYDMLSCIQGLMAGMSVRIGSKVKTVVNQMTGRHQHTYEYMDNVGEAVRIGHLCWAAHNAGLLRGSNTYHIGYCAAIMHRFGTAACLGEARHATGGRERKERDQIYKTAFSNPFQARKKLQRALWLFKNYHWGGGYGGEAWAECTQSVLDMDTAIIKLLNGDGAVVDLVQTFNRSVDKAHNHGWWLNKWAETHLFQQAADGNPQVVFEALPAMWEAEGLRGKTVPKAIQERVAKLDALGEYTPTKEVKAIVEGRTRHSQSEVKAQQAAVKAQQEQQAKQYENLVKPHSVGVVAVAKPSNDVWGSVPTMHIQWKTKGQVEGGRKIKYFTFNTTGKIEGMCEFCESALKYIAAHNSELNHGSFSGSGNKYFTLAVDEAGVIYVPEWLLIDAKAYYGWSTTGHSAGSGEGGYGNNGCKIMETFPAPKGFQFADGTHPSHMYIKQPDGVTTSTMAAGPSLTSLFDKFKAMDAAAIAGAIPATSVATKDADIQDEEEDLWDDDPGDDYDEPDEYDEDVGDSEEEDAESKD